MEERDYSWVVQQLARDAAAVSMLETGFCKAEKLDSLYLTGSTGKVKRKSRSAVPSIRSLLNYYFKKLDVGLYSNLSRPAVYYDSPQERALLTVKEAQSLLDSPLHLADEFTLRLSRPTWLAETVIYRLFIRYRHGGYLETLSRGSYLDSRRDLVEDNRLMIKLISLKKVLFNTLERHSEKKVGQMAIDFIIDQDFKIVLFSVERVVLVPEALLGQYVREKEAEAKVPPLIVLLKQPEKTEEPSIRARRRTASRTSTEPEQDFLSCDLFREVMIRTVERKIDNTLIAERLMLARDLTLSPEEKERRMPSREQVESTILSQARPPKRSWTNRRSTMLSNRDSSAARSPSKRSGSLATDILNARTNLTGKFEESDEATVKLTRYPDTVINKLQPVNSDSRLKRYIDMKHFANINSGKLSRPLTVRGTSQISSISPLPRSLDIHAFIIAKTERTARLKNLKEAPKTLVPFIRCSSEQGRAKTSKSKARRMPIEEIYKRSTSMRHLK